MNPIKTNFIFVSLVYTKGSVGLKNYMSNDFKSGVSWKRRECVSYVRVKLKCETGVGWEICRILCHKMRGDGVGTIA